MTTRLRFSKIALFLSLALLLTPLVGCLVAGYSSGGGWFVWPGSVVLSLVALIFFLLMRRR